MAKVIQRRANKDYPKHGIKKGETYYTWSLRFSKFGKGVVYKSKTHPKPSQTTSNAFWSQVYSIQEQLDDAEDLSREDLESLVDGMIGEIENLRDETQEKFDNMPDGLQQGDTGQILEGRVNGLEQWQSDLEDIKSRIDDEDEELEGLLQELQSTEFSE